MQQIDYGIGIIGCGHYLPANVQSNEELCRLIPELSPEWIISKTGIKRRFHISADESASSLAYEASKKAIERAGVQASDIGLVIVASFSQDYLFPPMSARIHSMFGMKKNCQIIDINTNCVGLVSAITIASERMMHDPSITHALLIGVEILSRYTNPEDKETAIFFSDGASAVVLGKTDKKKGYQNAKFMTDSSTYESVRMRAGGSSYPAASKIDEKKALYIEQNGLATWKQAVSNLPVVIDQLLKLESLPIQEVDFVIFHQANGFLIDYIMKKMKIGTDKTYTNVEEIGNTGSASIGIALSEAYEKGKIKPGMNLLIAGVGAGFNFGACLIKI